ncbi:hypothetical protein ACJX0J_029921, partial [Zea mays]
SPTTAGRESTRYWQRSSPRQRRPRPTLTWVASTLTLRSTGRRPLWAASAVLMQRWEETRRPKPSLWLQTPWAQQRWLRLSAHRMSSLPTVATRERCSAGASSLWRFPWTINQTGKMSMQGLRPRVARSSIGMAIESSVFSPCPGQLRSNPLHLKLTTTDPNRLVDEKTNDNDDVILIDCQKQELALHKGSKDNITTWTKGGEKAPVQNWADEVRFQIAITDWVWGIVSVSNSIKLSSRLAVQRILRYPKPSLHLHFLITQ